jgi:D-lactate dehydrogenase
LSGLLRRAISHDLVPTWGEPMPEPAPPLPTTSAKQKASAVYFPACVNRIFGNDPAQRDRPTLVQALVTVSARAGAPLWIPPDVAGLCCATPWSSKGFHRGHEEMSRRIADAVLRWTDDGRLPLVVDASSCTLGLVREVPGQLDENTRERFAAVEILDSIAWLHERLLQHLPIERKAKAVAVHPPCAAVHLGLQESLLALAHALAEEVVLPAATACCGTAGDRGLLHPELPAAALAPVAEELRGPTFDACLCSNRTCEIGLTQATGRSYESVVLLLEELTRTSAPSSSQPGSA